MVSAWVWSWSGLQQERDKTSSDGTNADKCGAGTTKEWGGSSSGRCSPVGAGTVTASTADKLKVGAGKASGV